MHERLAAARRALAEAPAHLVVEHLADHLAKAYGIDDAELYQVDYRLAALLPLAGGQALTGVDAPAWRSFDEQAEVIDGAVRYLPVTMRGERFGVLRLAPATGQPGELAETASMLAHELAAVRGSTDRYTVAARSQRLSLAAEMQWELLPGRSRVRPAFSLAGQLEPAYAVRGDSFDWADDPGQVYLTTLNGMGEGVAAATLSSLATNALRNARRAGLELSDQAALADQAVWAYHGGTQHVAALLLRLDLPTGLVTAVDAGSPRLMILRDGEVIEQELVAQFPLGMFEGTLYHEQRFHLAVGDRLFVVSDGVLDAISDTGRYGDQQLAQFVRDTRLLAPLQAVRSLLANLRAFVGGELVDDAVAVCLDWFPA
ncbi:serine/threonine-protein phosphatase [Micromonospora sp. CPCC 205371]|nr:serine/threonine-protein phosphatase [Micromonospora sp. CPCC 205371]